MTKRKRIRFIINPFSGLSKKNNIPELIDEHLDHTLFEHEISFTKYPLHAKFLAEEAKEMGLECVVAVGGDGTVNEIGSALVNSNTVLAILPAGSGNGFAMHLGMGRNIKKAIQLLNDAQEIKIDTCTANENFFINIAGVGFDSMVANLSKQDSSRGLWLYMKYTILRAFTYKQKEMEILIDGQSKKACYLSVSVANGSMFGYNFRIAPNALLTDGLLDVVLIKKAPLWKYLTTFWRFFNRTSDRLKYVDTIKCKAFKLHSQEAVYHHIDGEGIGQLNSLEVRIHEKSLNVLVPRASL